MQGVEVWSFLLSLLKMLWCVEGFVSDAEIYGIEDVVMEQLLNTQGL